MKKKLKVTKMKILTLKVTSRPNSKWRHCEDSVTNQDKVNVNYESDDLKNKIQWQIATSRNKHGHFTNTGKNTLERNRKFHEIHFEWSNRFSPLHNDDQNLTTKRPTSTIPSIPEKIPTNSRNTSPHATNTVRNKGHLYVPPRIT